jgi:alkanesulfonate monooxygenase SsuD/methylene tetrahydromethanopterin reductase-like flavin-dependent oxidoreductase (luciferase family)
LTLAKMVSTLDNFSCGRLILGIGVGWLREETELYGTDFDTRWAYTRESVLAMKALWKDGIASYSGKYINFPPVRVDPLPAQRPHPPVILGAPATDLSMKRAVTWCDGWLPVMPSAAEVADGRRRLTEACEQTGRDPKSVQITVFAMDATPETQHEYEEAGADRLVVGIYNHPGTALPYDQWKPTRAAALQGGRPAATETLRVLESIHKLAKL